MDNGETNAMLARMTTAILIVAVSLGAVHLAMANERRHHRVAPAAPGGSPHGDSRFYPESVEGGVRGNLPFNNQQRKFSDPLNANGGR